MKCNVGGVDRALRIIIGLAVGIAGIMFHSWWGLLAVIPLGTALLGWCPLYLPFGASTCKAKPAEE